MAAAATELELYFNRYLPALNLPSNFGSMAKALEMGMKRSGKGGGGFSPSEENIISDETLECLRLMHPIEAVLHEVDPAHLEVLRAQYEPPTSLRMADEWAWLTRETKLPLGLLGLAAHRRHMKRATFARWAKASTGQERTERGLEIAALAAEARQMLAEAEAAWAQAKRRQGGPSTAPPRVLAWQTSDAAAE